MIRSLFLLHRYLGICLGVILLVWCLSGFVMMYAQYPEMTPTEKLQGLEELDLSACCHLPSADEFSAIALESARVEMMGGRPVLRFLVSQRTQHVLELDSGRVLQEVTVSDAQTIATSYARQLAPTPAPHYLATIQRDQWTVYASYDPHRPLHHFSATDRPGAKLYVSSTTGEVVQHTTAHQRFWNWLGAVPHWLYPTMLRQHTYTWSQTVIWLTIVGFFLTIVGMYVGLRQLKSRRSGRRSPYRGAALWHHYAGLVFGILTLTWLVSGLFSMNPWGVLESRSFATEMARHRGTSLRFGPDLKAFIMTLPRRPLPAGTVRLEARVLNAERYFLAWNDRGMSLRLDASLASSPLSEDSFQRAATALKPGTKVSDQGWLMEEDAYYYNHHDKVDLPVYRIQYVDGERFYLDGVSGEIVYAVDKNRRLYRWLHYGLHRGDFTQFIRSRPIWDVLMVGLMLGVTISALTGTWMGLRRLARWLKRLRASLVPVRVALIAQPRSLGEDRR